MFITEKLSWQDNCLPSSKFLVLYKVPFAKRLSKRNEIVEHQNIYVKRTKFGMWMQHLSLEFISFQFLQAIMKDFTTKYNLQKALPQTDIGAPGIKEYDRNFNWNTCFTKWKTWIAIGRSSSTERTDSILFPITTTTKVPAPYKTQQRNTLMWKRIKMIWKMTKDVITPISNYNIQLFILISQIYAFYSSKSFKHHQYTVGEFPTNCERLVINNQGTLL